MIFKYGLILIQEKENVNSFFDKFYKIFLKKFLAGKHYQLEFRKKSSKYKEDLAIFSRNISSKSACIGKNLF